MNSFFIGCASSLVTTFVIYISRHIWINWFHLLLANNYPQISGKYRIEEKIPPNCVTPWYPKEKQILQIKQFGKQISGYFLVFDDDTEKHKFPLKGTVGTDRSALLSYESNDPKYKAKGSILVRFQGINSEFSGKHVFICLRCEEIHNFNIVLHNVST